MDFSVFKDKLVAAGYSDDTAYAKIAHDIVLKAIRDSGFHDNLTVHLLSDFVGGGCSCLPKNRL